MVAAGSFRADLYYRLNVLPIRLPALRERLDDIEALVDVLADDIARRSGMPHKGVDTDALAWLAAQQWPGNVRELRNVLEQASLMTDDLILGVDHFHGVLHAPAGLAVPTRRTGDVAAATAPDLTLALGKSLPAAIAELEARAIADALLTTAGNKLAASRLLGISRATLYEKLARLPPT